MRRRPWAVAVRAARAAKSIDLEECILPVGRFIALFTENPVFDGYKMLTFPGYKYLLRLTASSRSPDSTPPGPSGSPVQCSG